MLTAPATALPRPVPLTTGSPLRVCLQFLKEGHEPVTAIEFVADWSEGEIKQAFQDYSRRLKSGTRLSAILEEIGATFPSPETELLIAAMQARQATGQFPELVTEILGQTETAEQRIRDEMELLVGSGRRWTLGLIWVSLVGTAVLLIAFPKYSTTLLETAIGRVVFGIALAMLVTGFLWAGSLLRLQSRVEAELGRS